LTTTLREATLSRSSLCARRQICPLDAAEALTAPGDRVVLLGRVLLVVGFALYVDDACDDDGSTDVLEERQRLPEPDQSHGGTEDGLK
jgi:hypothetical protein